MNTKAICVEHLTRYYGPFLAVDDLSMEVEAGTVFGLLGPNGAGKTTTMNMLSGLLNPSGGSIEILGMDYKREAEAIKCQIGVMRDDLGLYEQLTGREYLSLIGRICGLNRMDIERRTDELFALMELSAAESKRIHQYSSGMKKKLCLTSIFIRNPKVLLLDEPFESIDPGSVVVLHGLLKQMCEKGTTVILTSHILSHVESIGDRIGIMFKGKLLIDMPVNEIETIVKDQATKEHYVNLESLYLHVIGKDDQKDSLSWL